MTSKQLCVFAYLILSVLPTCKQRDKDSSEVKADIKIAPQQIDKTKVKKLIKMVKDAWRERKGNFGTIPSAATFEFFNLTAEEVRLVEAARPNATTVTCETDHFCLLQSRGKTVYPTKKMYLNKEVNLYMRIVNNDVADFCRIEGVQVSPVKLVWSAVDGFYADGRDKAENSIVDVGSGGQYPKADCVFKK